MTLAEKWRNEGWANGYEKRYAEGFEEGVRVGTSKIMELIKSGLSPDEALRKFNEEHTALGKPLAQSNQ